MDDALYGGGHRLECIPASIESTETASPVTSGPQLKLAKVNLCGVTPNGNSVNWQRADGKYMPCSRCIVPSSDVVSIKVYIMIMFRMTLGQPLDLISF